MSSSLQGTYFTTNLTSTSFMTQIKERKHDISITDIIHFFSHYYCDSSAIFKYIAELTGNGSLASWIMKPSITCVKIFGFFDFDDDLLVTTGFSADFFSWFKITEFLVLSEITLAGFDLSSDVFAATGEVLTWS